VAAGIRWRSDPTTSRCRMQAVRPRRPVAGIHWPWGPTTGQRRMAELAARLAARHTFAFGSHHSPFAHSAELTPGVAIVTAAIGA